MCLHSRLLGCLGQLPRPFEEHSGAPPTTPQRLRQWADGAHDPGRAYSHDRGTRICGGVCAVWVLPWSSTDCNGGEEEDAAGSCSATPYALLPGSHTSELPTPSSIFTLSLSDKAAEDDTDGDLSLRSCCLTLARPKLRVGDLLLHASTLVHAVLPSRIPRDVQLATMEFVSPLRGNFPDDSALVAGTAAPAEWLARLSPTQQAALGWRPGTLLLPLDANADAAVQLSADLEPLLPPTTSTLRGEAGQWREEEESAVRDLTKHHASAMPTIPDLEGTAEQEIERYQWDCCGHLILRQVNNFADLCFAHDFVKVMCVIITNLIICCCQVMDPAWLDAANLALDLHNVEAGGQPLPAGGLLGLPPPHAQSFARMLDHPAVVRRLQWMMGPGWVIEGPTHPMTAVRGISTPLAIHSGGESRVPCTFCRINITRHAPQFSYRLGRH